MPRFTPAHLNRFAKALLLLFTVTPLSVFAANPVMFEGQKYTVQKIVDRQQGGMPFVALMVPEKWQLTGEVHWVYENVSNPVTASAHLSNPDKPEEINFFPRVACYWLQGAAAFNQPGTMALGQMNVQPMQPADALRFAVLQLIRPNRRGLQIVGAREMPGLAATLKTDPKTVKGVGVKTLYEENGQQIEEEFYALYYYLPIPYDGPQGHSIQTNWGLDRVHSFKAPRGTLDQNRGKFAFVVHSIEGNPTWTERAANIQNYLNDQFNRNLAQGYAIIEAAGRVSRAISANNDAMIANIDSQRAAANATSRASSPSGRSANDRFDDYVRGVDTMNDPYTGTSQHSSTEQYHWTDGYGNYTHSNDANFNPNLSSNITWQPMTAAR